MVWNRAIRASSKTGAIQHVDVDHAGDTYRVELRAVRAARRLTLRVSHSSGNVVLTMPPRVSVSDAHEFAQRYAAWIGARLRRLPEPVPFTPGAIIPLRGVEHRIAHKPHERGTVWLEAPGSDNQGLEAPLLCVAGEETYIARRLTDYLKKCAKQDLQAAVSHYCELLKVPSRPVTVRDTTSRWGSCSASGSLNFSWRLIFAPAFVLDYLAAHEVAHLVHMNHSQKFWTLTKKLCSETDRAEAWLNAHGPQLYRYGKTSTATQR